LSLDETTGAAAERTITLSGKTFRIGTAAMKTLGRVQAYLRANPPPDTLEELREIKEFLDPSALHAAAANALAERKNWPPDPHLSPGMAFAEMCQIPGGAEELLFLILLECRERGGCEPSLTDGDLRACAANADADSFTEAMLAAGRLGNSLTASRSRAQIVLVDRDGLWHYALQLVAALELEVEPERLEAAADAIELQSIGAAVRLEITGERPQIPKGEVRARPRRSAPSTSPPPTP
jgi:hypothetical protein